MIAAVRDENCAVARNGEAERLIEARGRRRAIRIIRATRRARERRDCALRRHAADGMVARVTHEERTIGAEGETGRAIKTRSGARAIRRARRAEQAGESSHHAIRGDAADGVVLVVRDKDRAVRRDSEAGGITKPCIRVSAIRRAGRLCQTSERVDGILSGQGEGEQEQQRDVECAGKAQRRRRFRTRRAFGRESGVALRLPPQSETGAVLRTSLGATSVLERLAHCPRRTKRSLLGRMGCGSGSGL